jgi:hypothetical protein
VSTGFQKRLGISSCGFKNRQGVLGFETNPFVRIYVLKALVRYGGQHKALISWGFIYLPYRANGLGNYWNYDTFGLGNWALSRKKLNREYRKAPVMMDRLQSVSSTGWYDAPYGTLYPDSCHYGAHAVPQGGNFLFEDGRVEWRKFDAGNTPGTIDSGSTGPASTGMYTDFYRPAELGPGPW